MQNAAKLHQIKGLQQNVSNLLQNAANALCAMRYVQYALCGMCNMHSRSDNQNAIVQNILSRFVENIVSRNFKTIYGTGGDPTLRVQCLDPPCRGSVLFQ